MRNKVRSGVTKHTNLLPSEKYAQKSKHAVPKTSDIKGIEETKSIKGRHTMKGVSSTGKIDPFSFSQEVKQNGTLIQKPMVLDSSKMVKFISMEDRKDSTDSSCNFGSANEFDSETGKFLSYLYFR